MNNIDHLKIFFSMLAMNLPTLIVCLIAGGILLMRREQVSNNGWFWALMGFGLLLALCFTVPLGQAVLQSWVFQDGMRTSRIWAFTAVGIFNSILHAVVYVFLLLAVLAGRPKTNS